MDCWQWSISPFISNERGLSNFHGINLSFLVFIYIFPNTTWTCFACSLIKIQPLLCQQNYKRSWLHCYTTTKLIWLHPLLLDLGVTSSLPMTLKYNNNVVLLIAANLVFLGKTKHIEMDCHFVRKKIQSKLIKLHMFLQNSKLHMFLLNL